MITVLSRLLIKDFKEFKNVRVRRAYGILCGAVGIALNVVLFAIKFVAGSLSGSIAITADAFNNLSDAGSSVITMVGFKMAGHAPDSAHPFGHGRFEYISGLLVSVIIIIMGYELFKDSFLKILNPENIEVGVPVIVILLISVAVKIYMAVYNRSIGLKIESPAMSATSKDSLSDTVATSVVLLATLVSKYTSINIDGYCGVLVSFFVLWAGISAAKDTVGPLLGQAPEKEFVEEIEKIVLSYEKDGIIGIHDLVVHDYGPGRRMISLHAEVPCNGDIMALHDLVDNIEHDLTSKLECQAIIHMDPVLVNDPQTDRLRAIVDSIIGNINHGYEERMLKNPKKRKQDELKKVDFHDFRIVAGPTHTNLIFDIVLPFDFDMEDNEVIEYVSHELRKVNPSYYAVISIDKSYI